MICDVQVRDATTRRQTASAFDFDQIGQTAGGSRGFVRDVAIKMPIPSRTTAPTTIHVGGTLSRYAAIPSPTMRMMKPTRYVPKDDIAVSGRVDVCMSKVSAEER